MRSGTGQVIYQSEDDHHVLLNGIPQFRAHEGTVVDPHVISEDLATILRANRIAKVTGAAEMPGLVLPQVKVGSTNPFPEFLRGEEHLQLPIREYIPVSRISNICNILISLKNI